MKKLLFLMLLPALLPLAVSACDICGCGVGNAYLGILPDFNRRIIGLRYRYNSIFTHVGLNGASTYLTTKELYRTVEIWGGWNVTKNFRVMASLPYSFDEKHSEGLYQTKNGIGDISVVGMYQLLNTSTTTAGSDRLVQSLWAGAGIKLATGKYNPRDKSVSSDNANLFQLGTGSTDFTFQAMYDIRLQDLGLDVTGNYKLNTTNRYGYSYGNKFSANAQAYYKIRVRKVLTIAPNAGVGLETAEHDIDDHLLVDASGGRLLMGTLGAELSCQKLSIGGNWQTPMSQDLARGIIKANNRMMVHVSVLL